MIINHKEIVAQGQVNRDRIDSAKLIAQVVKKTKAEIIMGKRKERAESSMEGLTKQGEALAKSKANSGKEQLKNALGIEDQKHNITKTDLEQKLREDKDSGKGSLSIHEIRVLNNQFEIDMYVEALRHYKAYYKISGEKDVIASDNDEESDLRD